MDEMDDTVCRLCLASVAEITESNCVLLWANKDKNATPPDNSMLMKIEEHLCLKLQDRDGLSKIICKICAEQLENLIDFKAKCHINNDYLMKTLNDNLDLDITEIISSDDDDDDSYIDLVSEIGVDTDESDEPEGSKEAEDSSNTTASGISARDLGGKRFTCKDCKRVETNMYKYLKHSCMVRKEKFECPDCTEIYDGISELENHLKYHKYPCPVCYKIYSKSYLWEHFPAHLGKFRCKLCLRSFQTMGGLKEHMKSLHVETRDFVCEECGGAFHTKHRLEMHRKGHNRDVTYKCDQCEYTTHMRQRLNAHKRWRHTPADGEPKFTCETCGKGFTQRARLTKHVSRVHNGRPHECHICGHRFSVKSNLKIHLNAKSSCLERIAARRPKEPEVTWRDDEKTDST